MHLFGRTRRFKQSPLASQPHPALAHVTLPRTRIFKRRGSRRDHPAASICVPARGTHAPADCGWSGAMLIQHEDLRAEYERMKVAACGQASSVLLLVAADCDATCAARILMVRPGGRRGARACVRACGGAGGATPPALGGGGRRRYDTGRHAATRGGCPCSRRRADAAAGRRHHVRADTRRELRGRQGRGAALYCNAGRGAGGSRAARAVRCADSDRPCRSCARS